MVRLNDVWAMLDACAPGYTRRKADHNWLVRSPHGGFATLPLGPQGHRRNSQIQAGHVRKLATNFRIVPCAKAKLPGAF